MVKAYVRKDGVKVKRHLAAYPKRRRVTKKATKKTARRRVHVRGYSKKSGKRVHGYYRKARKAVRRPAKKAAPRRYRVKSYVRKGRRIKSYLRSYKKAHRARKTAVRKPIRQRARKTARKTSRAIVARKPGRYRVRKPSGGTYLRSYPKKHRRVAKRVAKKGARKIIRIPALRKHGRIVRKAHNRKIAANPYKRSKVKVHPYSYTRHHPRAKRVSVPRSGKSFKRRQWYPHHYEGRWISQSRSKALGLLGKREMSMMARRHGMHRNPAGLMAMLPTTDQLMVIGKAAGVGFLGFGGAVAAGQALSRVSAIQGVTGSWTNVLGNLAAGIGFWALTAMMPDNEKLQEAKPYVMAGVGVATLVNIVMNLISSNTIPGMAEYAPWLIPGAVATAPVTTVVATNGATAGYGYGRLGQIDIYEAALNGVSGIEQELEMELDRMGGMGRGDGIFGDTNEGIFNGLDGTGTPVRQAYAGMGEYLETPMAGGAMVEQAFAGSGGMGEYFRTPMSGVNVKEAYSGMGEYFKTPMSGMGEYFKAPMGATVEEAFAGGMGQDTAAAAVEASIQSQPLMPGFRAAVQKMVRDRIAAGLPLDDAFYAQLGKAAANLARRKFQDRVAQVTGQTQDIDVQGWKPPVTNEAVPNFRTPIFGQDGTPGEPSDIEDYEGKGEDEGIFTGGEDEGIF